MKMKKIPQEFYVAPIILKQEDMRAFVLAVIICSILVMGLMFMVTKAGKISDRSDIYEKIEKLQTHTHELQAHELQIHQHDKAGKVVTLK